MVMGAGRRRGAAGEPGGSGGRRPSGSPLRLQRSHPRLAAYLRELLLLILFVFNRRPCRVNPSLLPFPSLASRSRLRLPAQRRWGSMERAELPVRSQFAPSPPLPGGARAAAAAASPPLPALASLCLSPATSSCKISHPRSQPRCWAWPRHPLGTPGTASETQNAVPRRAGGCSVPARASPGVAPPEGIEVRRVRVQLRHPSGCQQPSPVGACAPCS